MLKEKMTATGLHPLCEAVRQMIKTGALGEAEAEAARAMSRYPHAPEPHNLMGIILEKDNDHVGAMKHFRAAWALDPTYLPARINLEQYASFSVCERMDAYDESDCAAECGRKQDTYKIEYDGRGIGHVVRRH